MIVFGRGEDGPREIGGSNLGFLWLREETQKRGLVEFQVGQGDMGAKKRYACIGDEVALCTRKV